MTKQNEAEERSEVRDEKDGDGNSVHVWLFRTEIKEMLY